MNTTKRSNEILHTKILPSVFEAINSLSYASGYEWHGLNKGYLHSDLAHKRHEDALLKQGEEIKKAVNRFVDEQITAHVNSFRILSGSSEHQLRSETPDQGEVNRRL